MPAQSHSLDELTCSNRSIYLHPCLYCQPPSTALVKLLNLQTMGTAIDYIAIRQGHHSITRKCIRKFPQTSSQNGEEAL